MGRGLTRLVGRIHHALTTSLLWAVVVSLAIVVVLICV